MFGRNMRIAQDFDDKMAVRGTYIVDCTDSENSNKDVFKPRFCYRSVCHLMWY